MTTKERDRYRRNTEQRYRQSGLTLQASADRSLVFSEIAKGEWRTHLKGTNILERFFRELKRFEKSRQFRFVEQQNCRRVVRDITMKLSDKDARQVEIPSG